jgi:general L-amino acid transport system permease protein
MSDARRKGSEIARLRASDHALQAMFVAVLLAVVAGLVLVARANLARQSGGFGFDFLFSETGWDVASSLIPHSTKDPYWRTFLVGLLNTCLVAVICVAFATVFGTLVGLMSVSENPLLAGACLLFVNTIRNIPQILQVFFWYHVALQLPPVRQSHSIIGVAFLNNRGLYLPTLELGTGSTWLLAILVAGLAVCWLARRSKRRAGAALQPRRYWAWAAAAVALSLLASFVTGACAPLPRLLVPELKGFNFQGGFALSPEFVALVTAISLYNVAFIAELIRAGIFSVPKGQIEAARSLGLSGLVVFARITLPQALRVIVPPMTSQIMSITKSTSLAAAIAYTELFSVATIAIANTGRSFENIAILMVVYLTLSAAIALAGEAVAKAFRWPGAR